ncbi:hypothetical protein [Anatilimnocola floriformis]|uniref:hypothetical protein n=1 Tax=Anatilimnocola floriformis TaxID=2948575 RepID=UPI0020C59DAB|nr:hypothetical protein [Anatilimnocola floriformis]
MLLESQSHSHNKTSAPKFKADRFARSAEQADGLESAAPFEPLGDSYFVDAVVRN